MLGFLTSTSISFLLDINPSWTDAPSDPRDAFMLEGYEGSGVGASRSTPNVSWLRKTEYLSRDSAGRSGMSAADV